MSTEPDLRDGASSDTDASHATRAAANKDHKRTGGMATAQLPSIESIRRFVVVAEKRHRSGALPVLALIAGRGGCRGCDEHQEH